MNKKGVIVLVVIIILVIVGYSMWGGKDTSVSNTGTNTPSENVPEGVSKDTYAPVTSETTSSSLLARLKNISVSAAETGNRVALVNGSAKFSEGNVKGAITLGNVATEQKVGETTYVLASLAVNSGGSGTFHYVTLFEDKNGTISDKSYALIGDRVKITGIRADAVSDGSGAELLVSVSYLGHDQGEPLSSSPSVPKTKLLIVENGLFNPAKEINL